MECGRPRFNPWVRKISWRRKWQPTPVFLPGKSHGQRSQVGCHPWGREESDTTERFHFHFDHELLIVKFRFKLKKAGKTTRPFRYDLNQIPYDSDREPDELWTEVCDIVQQTGVKSIYMEKKCKKAK